jgi:hypothetical protein
MWTMFVKSKCPNCQKEYNYEEVVACVLPLDSWRDWMFDYNKICECGTTFNMKENKTNKVTLDDFLKSNKSKKETK